MATKVRLTDAQRDVLLEMKDWRLIAPLGDWAHVFGRRVAMKTVEILLQKGLIELLVEDETQRQYAITDEGRWAVYDGMEYSPPWGKPQDKKEFDRIHDRWAKWRSENLPVGVPFDEDGGLQTFGDPGKNGQPATYDGMGSSLQCGGCRYFIPLEGTIGGDWGVCSAEGGQYDGHVVFEHHTCPLFKY